MITLKTLKQEKNKVGCRKAAANWCSDVLLRNPLCGEIDEFGLFLCPTCQAKLEAYDNGIQAVGNQRKEIMKKLNKFKKDFDKDLDESGLEPRAIFAIGNSFKDYFEELINKLQKQSKEK
jgi:hypothetical protein